MQEKYRNVSKLYRSFKQFLVFAVVFFIKSGLRITDTSFI